MKLYTFAAVAILAITMAPVPQTQAGLLRNKRDAVYHTFDGSNFGISIGNAVNEVADTSKRVVNGIAKTTAVLAGDQLNTVTDLFGNSANTQTRVVGNLVKSGTGTLGGIVNTAAVLGGNNFQKQVGNAVDKVENNVARGVDTAVNTIGNAVNKVKKAVGGIVDTAVNLAGGIFHTDEPVEPNLINIPPNGKLVTLRGPDGKIIGHLECDLVPIVEQLIATSGGEILFRRSNKDKEVVVTNKAGDIITYFSGPIAHGIQNLRVHGPISVSLSHLGNVVIGEMENSQDILDEDGQIIDNVTIHDITVLPNGVTLVRDDPLLNMLNNKNSDLYNGHDLIHLGGGNSGIKNESDDVDENDVDGVVDNAGGDINTVAGDVAVNTVEESNKGNNSFFGNVVHDVLDNGKSIVNGVAETTAGVVGDNIITASGLMGDAVNTNIRATGDLANSAAGILGSIVNATAGLAGTSVQNRVGGLYNKVQNNVQRGVDGSVNIVGHYVNKAKNSIRDFFQTAYDMAGNIYETDEKLQQPGVINVPPKSKIVTLRGVDGKIIGHLNGDLVPIVQNLITTPGEQILFKRPDNSNKDNEIVVTNKDGDILTYITGAIAKGILNLAQPISVSISRLGTLIRGIQTILDEPGRIIDKVTKYDVYLMRHGLALVRDALKDAMMDHNYDIIEGANLIHLHD